MSGQNEIVTDYKTEKIFPYIDKYVQQYGTSLGIDTNFLQSALKDNDSVHVAAFVEFLAQKKAIAEDALFLAMFRCLISNRDNKILPSLMKIMPLAHNASQDFGTKLILMALVYNDIESIKLLLAQGVHIFWNKFYLDEAGTDIKRKIIYYPDKNEKYEITVSEAARRLLFEEAKKRRKTIENIIQCIADWFEGYDAKKETLTNGATQLPTALEDEQRVYTEPEDDARKLNVRNWLRGQNFLLENLQRLTQAGFNINARVFRGKNLLHLACQSGNMPAFDYLMAHGANANMTTKNGETPLYIAMDNNRGEMVTQLLEAKASLEVVDEFGSTQLMLAAKNQNLPVYRQLIHAGANAGAHNKLGQGVAHFLGNKIKKEALSSVLDERLEIPIQPRLELKQNMSDANASPTRLAEEEANASMDQHHRDSDTATNRNPDDIASEQGDVLSSAAVTSQGQVAEMLKMGIGTFGLEGEGSKQVAKSFADDFFDAISREYKYLKVQDYINIFMLLQYHSDFRALRVKQNNGTESVSSLFFFSDHAQTWRKVVYTLKCNALKSIMEMTDPLERRRALMMLCDSELMSARTTLQFKQSTMKGYLQDLLASEKPSQAGSIQEKLMSYSNNILHAYQMKQSGHREKTQSQHEKEYRSPNFKVTLTGFGK